LLPFLASYSTPFVRGGNRYADYQSYAKDDSDQNQQSPKRLDAHTLLALF